MDFSQPGKKRTLPYLGDHIRQNVIGAVCPEDGQLFSIIVDGVDTDVFQVFLDEMAKACSQERGIPSNHYFGQCVMAQSQKTELASSNGGRTVSGDLSVDLSKEPSLFIPTRFGSRRGDKGFISF